jgi:membrane protein YdbS with pleckstrin-like domain
METLVGWLRPLFLPLLKLDPTPPHLPEGSSLVRQLKPTEQWLAYRYLAALFGLLYQFIGAGVGAVALVTAEPRWGLLGAALLLGVEVVVIGFTLVAIRVDYELRHYLVGDRSLRVVQGAWKREEVTLSYANIQNIEVNQGPLERVFGFKSLTISTAGSDAPSAGGGRSLGHSAALVGLADAEELKRLILDMLKGQRDSGLGEAQAHEAPALPLERLEEVLAAARALRDAATGQTH